ncbi:MAG: hypothetical protein ACYCUM_10745 [Solirubrobacteraceae bacterium]
MSSTPHSAGEGAPLTPLTPLDESYGHQLVAVRASVEHADAGWQERCYHLLYAGDELMLDVGRSLWPQSGARRAFIGVSDGRRQRCVRVERPFAIGEDVDAPCVEGVCVEVLRPLERVRLRYGGGADELALDLTYTARFPPVATTPVRVEREGALVTHYMNFFQSGFYDGWVQFEGRRHEVRRRLGFRDRGWGVRKHEGAPRRGLVLGAFCELPDAAVYMLMFETASGRRVLSDGWRIGQTGGVQRITAIEHELRFEQRLLSGGAFALTLDDGSVHELRVHPQARLFLEGVGYSACPERQAAGVARYAVDDPAVRESLRGQTDHGCVFELDGVLGHGYVETGLGTHARYAPIGSD